MAVAVVVIVGVRLGIEVLLQRGVLRCSTSNRLSGARGVDQAFGAQGAGLVDQRGVRQLPSAGHAHLRADHVGGSSVCVADQRLLGVHVAVADEHHVEGTGLFLGDG